MANLPGPVPSPGPDDSDFQFKSSDAPRCDKRHLLALIDRYKEAITYACTRALDIELKFESSGPEGGFPNLSLSRKVGEAQLHLSVKYDFEKKNINVELAISNYPLKNAADTQFKYLVTHPIEHTEFNLQDRDDKKATSNSNQIALAHGLMIDRFAQLDPLKICADQAICEQETLKLIRAIIHNATPHGLLGNASNLSISSEMTKYYTDPGTLQHEFSWPKHGITIEWPTEIKAGATALITITRELDTKLAPQLYGKKINEARQYTYEANAAKLLKWLESSNNGGGAYQNLSSAIESVLTAQTFNLQKALHWKAVDLDLNLVTK